jgi:hypothetical protein
MPSRVIVTALLSTLMMAPTLVVYAPSVRGDASLREAVRAGGPLRVVALAPEERPLRACCGMQSGFWNGVQREMAESELARARLAVEDAEDVTLSVLAFDVVHRERAIARHAEELGAARVVLADPRAIGLSRRALRRLRGWSRAPVVDGAAV